MRKFLMIGFLAFSTIVPAHAGGSMSREVSIIWVEPTYEVQAQSRLNVLRKEEKFRAREAYKQELRDNRDAKRAYIQSLKDADKAYAKKLAAQRKARKK